MKKKILQEKLRKLREILGHDIIVSVGVKGNTFHILQVFRLQDYDQFEFPEHEEKEILSISKNNKLKGADYVG